MPMASKWSGVCLIKTHEFEKCAAAPHSNATVLPASVAHVKLVTVCRKKPPLLSDVFFSYKTLPLIKHSGWR